MSQSTANFRRRWRGVKAIFVSVYCLLCFTLEAQDQRSDLENIKSLIEQTKAQLNKNLAESERLQQELKLAELEIAQTATQISNTERTLQQTSRDISALEIEQKALEQQISDQQDLLAKQLRSAYMAGDYDYAKMLFNQEQANKLERVLTYYKYINQARMERIDGFKQLIGDLQAVAARLLVKQDELSNLRAQQSKQQSTLESQQSNRIQSLRKLNQLIESDQSRVTRLEQQEKDLANAIEQAELAAARLKEQQSSSRALAGLKGREGALLSPSKGNLRALFGKRRQGQVTWKGVMFNAPSGSPAQAIAEGKVLYADWLKGFGLVIIVDHGEGYMSVYGHNQALLKSVGDYVNQGDNIALIGASGGQELSGLYFEIRHKGKALNPSQWLAR